MFYWKKRRVAGIIVSYLLKNVVRNFENISFLFLTLLKRLTDIRYQTIYKTN